MTITAPQPVETSTQSPLGAAVPITRHPFQPSPLNRRRWQNFKANRRGYWSFWIFLVLFTVSLFANFIANDQPLVVKYDGRLYWPVYLQLFRDHLRRRFRNHRRLSRSLSAEADRREGRHHHLAADPLLLRHPQSRPADAGAVEADLDADGRAVQGGGAEEGSQELPRPRIQLARHRRPEPRRGRAPDLRFPHFGAVRTDAHHPLLDHRHRRRRRAGLFRRLDRPRLPAVYRNLDRDPLALSAPDHIGGAAAGLLHPARHSAAVLLGVAGRPGARRIPARAKFRIYPGGAGARRLQSPSSCSAICCRTRWWRP